MYNKTTLTCMLICLVTTLQTVQATEHSCSQKLQSKGNGLTLTTAANTCIWPGEISQLTPEADGTLTPEQSANLLGSNFPHKRATIDIELNSSSQATGHSNKLEIALSSPLTNQEHLYIFKQGSWHVNQELKVQSKINCRETNISWQEGLVAGNSCVMLASTVAESRRAKITAILNQNQPPVATPDNAQVFTGTFSYLSPLGNDYDPDGDEIRLVDAEVDHGRFTLNRNSGHILNYIPPNNFTGIARGKYKITDGELSAETEIVLNVIANTNASTGSNTNTGSTTSQTTSSSSSSGGGSIPVYVLLAGLLLALNRVIKSSYPGK